MKLFNVIGYAGAQYRVKTTVFLERAGRGRRYILVSLFLLLVMAVAVLTSCAAKGPPPPPGGMAARFQSDAALFREGYERLRGVERPKDYAVARQAFLLLKEKYPKSKWRGYADLYLSLLDQERKLAEELQSSGNQLKAERESREALAAREEEMEKERQELRSLLEKGRADTLRLQQENQSLRHENDRLRNNIDSLKRLEIELDRRDKLYR